MKNRYTLYILLLLPLLTTACSDSDESLFMEQSEPVEFDVALGSATRAGTTLDDVWPSGATVAICTGTTTKSYQTSGSGSTVNLIPSGSDSFIWAVDGNAMVYKGWYPFSESELSTLTVEADQRVDDIAITSIATDGTLTAGNTVLSDQGYLSLDKLYAPAVTVPYKRRASLMFYHQLCRVVVNVNSAATNNFVWSVTMGDNNLNTSSEYSRLGKTGETATDNNTKSLWTTTSGSEVIKMRRTAYDKSLHTATYECILPPQSGGDYDHALFTLKTTKYKSTTDDPTFIYKDAFDLQAGYQYTYNLLLSRTGALTIATVTVSNWSSVVFDNGDANVPDDVTP